MWKQNRELWLSLLAVIIITAVYALFIRQTRSIPSASGLFGHLVGVIGFLFMLMAESLYSLRKRSRKARWGKMSNWLQFHIFTGIVGPYMVLLHTSWKFNGLAGASLALTIIIVLSGFVGRYIYTRIPRTIDGVEIIKSALQEQASSLAKMRRNLALWYAIHIPIGVALFVASFIHIGAALYYATLLF
jgi:hypothetical protein